MFNGSIWNLRQKGHISSVSTQKRRLMLGFLFQYNLLIGGILIFQPVSHGSKTSTTCAKLCSPMSTLTADTSCTSATTCAGTTRPASTLVSTFAQPRNPRRYSLTSRTPRRYLLLLYGNSPATCAGVVQGCEDTTFIGSTQMHSAKTE